MLPCWVHFLIRFDLIKDIDMSRLEFAKIFCANEIHQLPLSDGDPLVAAKAMLQQLRSKNPSITSAEVIYECTGAPICLQLAIHVFL